MELTNITDFSSTPEMADLAPPYPYKFPENTHVIVASYLVTIGILGTLGNTVILAMFMRFRSLVSPTSLLLINLAVSDLGLILFGFPFSASSSFSGKWIFGHGGCQWYAFTGFLFGSAHIGTLTVLAVDRYLSTCRSSLRKEITYGRYIQILGCVWGYALFWAIMPILGWARYGPEPSVTTCTIDWQHNDASYKSFIVVYFVLGFVIPLIVISACYAAAARYVNRRFGGLANRNKELSNDTWSHERSITKMSAVLVITFVIAWSPYAIVCLWPIFADPLSMPALLTLMPPLVAKASTIFDPIIYFFCHPRFRAGILATLLCACQKPPPEMIEIADPSEKTPVATNSM